MRYPAAAPFITDRRATGRRLDLALLIGTIANVALWAANDLMPKLQSQFGRRRTQAFHPYIPLMLGFAPPRRVAA